MTNLESPNRGQRPWAALSISLFCSLASAQAAAADGWEQAPAAQPDGEPRVLLQRGPERPAFALGFSAPPRFAIVELPREGPPGQGPKRSRHALSIRSEAAEQWLRGLGVDATQCATHVRLPSSWRQQGANGGGGFEIRAQVRLVCRF